MGDMTQPKLTRLRGGLAVSYWVGGKRRRHSLGTSNREEAKRLLASWTPPPPAVPRAEGDSSVYFIRSECANRYIKIGIATHIPTRLSQLQVNSAYPLVLIATMPGGRDKETELHKRFEDAHERGEWFRPTDDPLAFIEALPKPEAPTPTTLESIWNFDEEWSRRMQEFNPRIGEEEARRQRRAKRHSRY